MNELALPYLRKMFSKHAALHDRDTRNREMLHIKLHQRDNGRGNEIV